MFANPLWSLLILAGLAAMYIIIRIKHGGPLFDVESRVDGWFASWWDWIVRFRSWVVTFVAGLAVSLPDLIVAIAPVDFSWAIGADYAKIVAGLLTTFLAINAAFKTRAGNTPAP